MAEICSCEDGVIGFGQPSCIPSFDRDKKLIFVSYLDNTGAVNSIKSTDTLDAQYFEDKVNAGIGSSALDKSQRWHITQEINDITGERAEPVTESIDNIDYIVTQGTRKYIGSIVKEGAVPAYMKSLESISCQKMGYFIIDVQGNIIGMKNDITGELDPIKIETGTFFVNYKFRSSSEKERIMLQFNIGENERDSDLNFVPASSIGVDVLELSSVIQVNGVTNTPLTTGVVVDFSFIYGSVFAAQTFDGALPGDFIATNKTTGLAVTIVTAAELPDGTYTFTWVAEPSANEIEIEIDKIGFVGSVTYTTP